MEHTTPQVLLFLKPVHIVSHFQMADGKGWHSVWCNPSSKHPSTLLYQVPNQAQLKVPNEIMLSCKRCRECNCWVLSRPAGERTVSLSTPKSIC